MRFSALLLALVLAAAAHAQWVECSHFGFPSRSPTDPALGYMPGDGAIIHAGNGWMNQYAASGVWQTVSVSPYVPTSAVAVFLSGTPLITHGYTAELCDMHISFRATGETTEYVYTGQILDVFVGSGNRNHFAMWVPVRGGMLDYKLWYSTPEPYPTHCAYGLNLKINGWCRP